MRCPHASFRVIMHVLCCGCDDDDDCSMLHSPRRAMNVRCIINAAANGLIHSRIVNQLTGVRRFYILPVDVYKHNARTGTTRGDGFFFLIINICLAIIPPLEDSVRARARTCYFCGSCNAI